MKRKQKKQNNEFNFNFDKSFEFEIKEFIKFMAIFILFVSLLSLAIRIVDKETDSDYDKCLNKCDMPKSEYEMKCIDSCTDVLLIQEGYNITEYRNSYKGWVYWRN